MFSYWQILILRNLYWVLRKDKLLSNSSVLLILERKLGNQKSNRLTVQDVGFHFWETFTPWSQATNNKKLIWAFMSMVRTINMSIMTQASKFLKLEIKLGFMFLEYCPPFLNLCTKSFNSNPDTFPFIHLPLFQFFFFFLWIASAH